MKTTLTETEIAEFFKTLGISSEEDRQRFLSSLGFSPLAKKLESARFDIGFNATLPGR